MDQVLNSEFCLPFVEYINELKRDLAIKTTEAESLRKQNNALISEIGQLRERIKSIQPTGQSNERIHPSSRHDEGRDVSFNDVVWADWKQAMQASGQNGSPVSLQEQFRQSRALARAGVAANIPTLTSPDGLPSCAGLQYSVGNERRENVPTQEVDEKSSSGIPVSLTLCSRFAD